MADDAQELAELRRLDALEAKASGAVSKTEAPQPETKSLQGLKDTYEKGMRKLSGGLNEDERNQQYAGQAVGSVPVGALEGLIKGGAEKLGLSKVPDYIMQKAVGMKKYIPGVGSTLVDEGLVGTKGMMQGQAEKKLAQHGGELEKAVESIPSKIDSAKVAESVQGHTKDYMTPEGTVPASVQGEVDAIRSRGQDIASRGEVAPKEALSLSRIAGKEGYRNGNPLAALDAKLAQSEQGAYSGALKNAYGEANPGAPNAVADANEKLSALIKGKKALNTPATIRKGLPLTDMATSAAGLSLGGPAGAAGGMIAAQMLKSPLVQSGTAQLLQKGGQAVSSPVGLKLMQRGAVYKKHKED